MYRGIEAESSSEVRLYVCKSVCLYVCVRLCVWVRLLLRWTSPAEARDTETDRETESTHTNELIMWCERMCSSGVFIIMRVSGFLTSALILNKVPRSPFFTRSLNFFFFHLEVPKRLEMPRCENKTLHNRSASPLLSLCLSLSVSVSVPFILSAAFPDLTCRAP
jgi:hypothetical protein